MNNESRTSYASIPLLITVLVVYAILVIILHHYERMTGDATLYLSIAEKYLRGDFRNAINGYWGPLLSWLLVPFLYAGASHLFAINAMNLIFGLLTIWGVWRLSYRFDLNGKIRSIILIPLVPILYFVSLIQPMDFLLLCVLVFYLNVVFREDYSSRLLYAVQCGILGAMAYFSKPYGFPFFITHFLMINACHYFGSSGSVQRRHVVRNAAVGFMIFALLSGIWIALISMKYDRLTFSNMGGGVMASMGPGAGHHTLEKGDPIFFEGFFKPPNETAYVIYEDPTYARKKSWSPLKSQRALRHYVSNIAENVFEGLRITESFSRLSIPILIGYLWLILSQAPGAIFSRRDILYPLLTLILYMGGYLPFHYETRYLWIISILLLLMGGRVLYELLKSDALKSGVLEKVLIMLFILSFVISPVKTSMDIVRDNINREMHTLGEELSTRYGIQGKIASNRERIVVTTHDSWHRTFRLSYWLKSRYFGQAKEDITDEDLQIELKHYGIDYYFFWGDAERLPQFLKKYHDITDGEIPGLLIFRMHE